MALELDAELVVLSACETQLGKSTSGEGFQGLVRAFLQAGAQSVIASAWKVPDRASASLLPEVYRVLFSGGKGAADALRQAQLEYLDGVPEEKPDLGSPFYWGAWSTWGFGIRPPS